MTCMDVCNGKNKEFEYCTLQYHLVFGHYHIRSCMNFTIWLNCIYFSTQLLFKSLHASLADSLHGADSTCKDQVQDMSDFPDKIQSISVLWLHIVAAWVVYNYRVTVCMLYIRATVQYPACIWTDTKSI